MVVLKVLIVEDSAFARVVALKVIGTLLPSAELFEAVDGEAGLASFHSVCPDLIITDLLMPKMTGDEMIREIRLTDTRIPIIVMTANVQKPVREKLEAMDVAGVVAKPLIGDGVKKLQELVAECMHVE